MTGSADASGPESTASGSSRPVGFIGLGRMGVPMARHLTSRGFDVMVYNRSLDRAIAFADETGARYATKPADVARHAEVVILMLASGEAVIDVLEGDNGLCSGLSPGSVVVDMGTTGVALTAVARAAVSACGAEFVEAPVSGSTASVEGRTMLVMTAGDPDAIARALPALEGIADRIAHMGGPGTGAAMKLAVNAVLFGINQAVAESLVMAERAGIDRSAAYDIFASSAVAAPVVIYRRAVFENPGTTPVTFSIDLAVKDLELVLDLAAEVGAKMPQAETNARVMRQSVAEGLGGSDMGDVAVHLRDGS